MSRRSEVPPRSPCPSHPLCLHSPLLLFLLHPTAPAVDSVKQEKQAGGGTKPLKVVAALQSRQRLHSPHLTPAPISQPQGAVAGAGAEVTGVVGVAPAGVGVQTQSRDSSFPHPHQPVLSHVAPVTQDWERALEVPILLDPLQLHTTQPHPLMG